MTAAAARPSVVLGAAGAGGVAAGGGAGWEGAAGGCSDDGEVNRTWGGCWRVGAQGCWCWYWEG